MNALKLGAFSVMLAMGGLPLYVHLPQFVGGELGISLAILGIMLISFRLLDMIQDPFLGWFIDRYCRFIRQISIFGASMMMLGFLGVFVFPIAGASPTALTWLSASAFLLFSGYSMLNIILYRQSSLLQQTTMPNAARIRELGLLFGVVLGSILPFVFLGLGLNAYGAYGIMLALFTIFVALFASSLWQQSASDDKPLKLGELKEVGANRLLFLLFLNTLPVAITSTLFVFFVRDRLQLESYTGLFLSLFFIACMAGVVLFSKLYEHISARSLLIVSMLGAIVSFAFAYFIPAGASLAFSIVCVFSGLFLGCELYLLPVIFAQRLADHHIQAGAAFGIWSFVGKVSLALAAALVLPILTMTGFSPNGLNSPRTVAILALSYALLPCLIKLVAIVFIVASPKEIV